MIQQYRCSLKKDYVNISQLSRKQRLAYNVATDYYQEKQRSQLKVIKAGQGGSGKSYVINAIQSLLKQQLLRILMSFFGIASFNVGGVSLHNLLKLPINCKNE